jgi:hypothetical protein
MDVKLKIGSVTRITARSGQMMMARSVEWKDDRFFFRDEQGKPYWN